VVTSALHADACEIGLSNVDKARRAPAPVMSSHRVVAKKAPVSALVARWSAAGKRQGKHRGVPGEGSSRWTLHLEPYAPSVQNISW